MVKFGVMIPRTRHISRILDLLEQFPVVALIGARQVGKSTLARELCMNGSNTSTFFDLEDPKDLNRLMEPRFVLDGLEGLVVLDEIQHQPDLFPLLRVLADRPGIPARFLILGSASPDLLRQSSDSLAGRIAYYKLSGFSLSEIASEHWRQLWQQGGFPLSFLANSERTSKRWRTEFIRTHLERDLPCLGIRLPATTMRRFWSMLAHYHGQVWNGAELARAFGVSEKTVRHYLDILTSTFMVRRLSPWHGNLAKRQVKSPKIYLADPGILHSLLDIGSYDQLLRHPKVGASWEGFALTEVVSALDADSENCFFWALHSGAELDLLIVQGDSRLGFEFKFTDSPRTTRSMHSALDNLKLKKLFVVHAGEEAYPLSDQIDALPLVEVRKRLA